MAKEPISIKGTRDGLVIFFDPRMEFEEIKKNLKRKCEAAKDFFRGAKFTLCRASYLLTSFQCAELENICRQYGLVPSKNICWPQEFKVNTVGEQARLFFKTLRSGQQVDYPGNAVIIGDVHPGAKVNAGGNIIVMGRCLGSLNAGISNNLNAMIIALRLAPERLTIGGVELIKLDNISQGPELAMFKNGRIIILPYLRFINKTQYLSATK